MSGILRALFGKRGFSTNSKTYTGTPVPNAAYDHTPTLQIIHGELEGGWTPLKKTFNSKTAVEAPTDTSHIPTGYDFPPVLKMYEGAYDNMLP